MKLKECDNCGLRERFDDRDNRAIPCPECRDGYLIDCPMCKMFLPPPTNAGVFDGVPQDANGNYRFDLCDSFPELYIKPQPQVTRIGYIFEAEQLGYKYIPIT